jgi:5'-deoxynucleotidase YfbR-like HD superfamily hydrolase
VSEPTHPDLSPHPEAPRALEQLEARNRHGWFQTFTGRKVYVLDPKPEDIEILDIAHALSMLCRYNGHCKAFYSVAQHSVIVSRIVPPDLAVVGLLHDATEAYVGDMIRPLKQSIVAYREIEDRWALAIGERYGLGDQILHLERAVKDADNVALATERRDLLNVGPGHALHEAWKQYDHHKRPLDEVIVPLGPAEAERAFMHRLEDICNAL